MFVEILDSKVPVWMVVPAVFAAWVFCFSIIKKLSFSIARKFAAKTATQIDDILFDAMDLPLQLMIYATAILVVQSFIPKGGMDISRYLASGFKAASIFAAVLFIDKFLRGLVGFYARRVDLLRTSGGVVQGFIRVLIMGLGILVILDSFGVSVTPILASLGIGSLAVALALQPTLENFFSGIQLIADKPIQVGHFIRLESGEEGTVERIGWRSTWVCQSNNNMIVIPNKILINAKVLNYHYPDSEMAVLVGVSVHYGSDLDKVEKVTIDVAREIMQQCPGGVSRFEPFIRYHTFADSGINYNVIMRSKDWPSMHLVKHEFIKRLQKKFAQEGIVIPYPMRTIIQGS